jgi:hypothetical protein
MQRTASAVSHLELCKHCCILLHALLSLRLIVIVATHLAELICLLLPLALVDTKTDVSEVWSFRARINMS